MDTLSNPNNTIITFLHKITTVNFDFGNQFANLPSFEIDDIFEYTENIQLFDFIIFNPSCEKKNNNIHKICSTSINFISINAENKNKPTVVSIKTIFTKDYSNFFDKIKSYSIEFDFNNTNNNQPRIYNIEHNLTHEEISELEEKLKSEIKKYSKDETVILIDNDTNINL